MKPIIIIPTLNENKNLKRLITKIFSIDDYDVLIIDDDSKDGSISVLKKLKKKYRNLKYIIRKKKKGIGSAHLDGILYAYKKKYQICVTLDADGTHDPYDIKKIINIINKKKIDVINTTRFQKKNSLIKWPYFRKILTLFRYLLVKQILNLSFDSSSGFRCYNLKSIKIKYFQMVRNKNYFFLIEIIYILHKYKYQIFDVPVKLKFRKQGLSKMKFYHILESLIDLIMLRFRNI